MKRAMSSDTVLRDDTTDKFVGWVMFALVLLVFTGHMFFFTYQVGVTSLEQAFAGRANARGFYGDLFDLIAKLTPGSQSVLRYLSITCALFSTALLAVLTTRWSGDRIVGASIIIGFVLFPVSTYVYALSTPFSLLMMLSALALWTACDRYNSALCSAISGALSGAIVLVDPSGLGLSIGASLLILASLKGPSSVVAYCVPFATAIGLAFVSGSFPAISLNLPYETDKPVSNDVDGLFFSYAMLWVALVFSSVALSFSTALRQRMGLSLVRRSVMVKLSFAAAFLVNVTIQATPVERMISFNALLMLGVLACLPLVLWLRWVMPHLRSVWVWILLPVVMYSCFWVVLGPIDWGGFPYDQISATP